jgi:hypothetical protein
VTHLKNGAVQAVQHAACMLSAPLRELRDGR